MSSALEKRPAPDLLVILHDRFGPVTVSLDRPARRCTISHPDGLLEALDIDTLHDLMHAVSRLQKALQLTLPPGWKVQA